MMRYLIEYFSMVALSMYQLLRFVAIMIFINFFSVTVVILAILREIRIFLELTSFY